MVGGELRTTVIAAENVSRSAAVVPMWSYLNHVQFLRNSWRGRALIVQFTQPEIRFSVAYKETS